MTPDSEVPEQPRLFSRGAALGSCAGFVVIGALQSLYGPSIPALQEKFDISPSTAGLGLSSHFAGAVLGVLVFYRLHHRLTNRTMLAVAYILTGLGSVLFALAPAWPAALAAAFLAGLGFGGIDYGINQLFSVGFGRRSAAMLNLLHAQFGIGAVLGPALIAWWGADNYPWIYGAVTVVSVGLLLTLSGVRQGSATPPAEGADLQGGGEGRRALAVAGAFIAIYVLHVAVETGVGGWEPTHLEAVGYTASAAATATSAFWLMMTAGRFLAAPLSLRFSAPTIVTGSCAGMAVCLALAAIPSLSLIAYLGVGLFIAPIFPTGLPWLNRAVPAVAGASAYVIAASMLGGVVFPPVLGGAIEVSGVRAVPILLFLFALTAAALSVWLRGATRHADPSTTPAGTSSQEGITP